jgi:hypothetical protein
LTRPLFAGILKVAYVIASRAKQSPVESEIVLWQQTPQHDDLMREAIASSLKNGSSQ